VTTPQVLLVPGNPLDLRPDELQPLVEDIKTGQAESVDISVRPLRGYGVTWWEVLVIYLAVKGADAVVGHAYQLLLDDITEKVKRWYRERRAAKGNKRPLHLAIRDDEGQVLRAIEMRPSGETADVTDKEREKPLTPRPDLSNADDA
jgi:hypothetical protein